MKKPSFSLEALAAIIKGITGKITIGDIKAAASYLTTSPDKVIEYLEGRVVDSCFAESLIAYLSNRMEARGE